MARPAARGEGKLDEKWEALMGYLPPIPPDYRGVWRSECAGCGAPLRPREKSCSYCLRATGYDGGRIEVTTIHDPRPIYVPQPSDDLR